jgi:cell division protein FtsB
MPDKDVPQAATPFLRPRPPSSRLARGSLAWLIGLALGLLGLLLLTGENGLLHTLHLMRQRDALIQQRDALEARNAALEQRLQDLQADPFALETLARERYNMRREGEDVILVLPADEAEVPTPKQP